MGPALFRNPERVGERCHFKSSMSSRTLSEFFNDDGTLDPGRCPGLPICERLRRSPRVTSQESSTMLMPFQGRVIGVTTIARRVATTEKRAFSRFHCVATRRAHVCGDLVPALKGRAKLIATLRVALLQEHHD